MLPAGWTAATLRDALSGAEVAVEGGQVVVGNGVDGASAGWAAGIVDEDVDRAGRGECRHLGLQWRGVGDIDGDAVMVLFAGGTGQGSHHLRQYIGATRQQRDAGAQQRQFMGGGAADAFGGAADEGVPAGEVEVHAKVQDGTEASVALWERRESR